MIDAIRKESLSDSIARAVKQMIDQQGFEPGDRLPSISEMARRFEVGAPTLREALRQLQAVGIVDMRHGSGVYVAENHNALFLANPIRPKPPSRKGMVDLIDTRLALETYTTGLAAEGVTETDLGEMEDLLARAEAAVDDGDLTTLSTVNMEFHRTIARASGNQVAHHVLGLLSGLFRSEQYTILELYGSPRDDLEEHKGILEALRAHDAALAVGRMREHLEGVRSVVSSVRDAEIDEMNAPDSA